MFWRRGRRSGDGEREGLRDETEPATGAADESADADELDADELDADELDDLEGASDDEDEAAASAAAGGEGTAATADAPEDMTADLEAQAREYLADNDTWMYGPNAEAALRLLDQLEELEPADAEVLVEAWRSVPKVEREVARKAARKLAEEDEGVERYLRLARESVGTWMAVSSEYPDFVKGDPEWPRMCAQAGEAALDALTGLILVDELDEADYASLFGPWADSVDAPAEAEQSEPPADADRTLTESAAGTGAGGEAPEPADEAADDGEFGPNSVAVADLLNRLWLLTPEQVGRLVANWQQTPREGLEHAHRRLREVVDEDAEWRRQVRIAQQRLDPWLSGGRSEESSAYLGRTGQGEVRRTAGPALADAIAALVVGDLLAPEDVETLYRPWFSLMGTPPMPVGTTDGDADGGPDDGSGEAGDGLDEGDEANDEPAANGDVNRD